MIFQTQPDETCGPVAISSAIPAPFHPCEFRRHTDPIHIHQFVF
jgi:hypothetical protein